MNPVKRLSFTQLSNGSIALATILAFIAMLGNVPASNVQSRPWRLKTIKVFNKLSSFNTVTREQYNETGGSVDIQIDGASNGLCPGGTEKLRFNWQFEGDITSIVDGGGLSVNLQAGAVGVNKPCIESTFTQFSPIYIYGQRGVLSPLSDDDNKLVDGERFFNVDGNYRLFADEGKGLTVRIGVATNPVRDNLPLAFFSVNVATRAGGQVTYVYVYQRGGGGYDGERRGGNFAIEFDTDRRGGDYKNFDLPEARYELCQAACANDANCLAFTYVKPGVQGSSARCWLKNSVPRGEGGLSCCTSGVKR